MKYLINRFFIALVLIASLVSCKKSFLDQSPNISLPVDNAITTEQAMLEGVAGMYRSMMTYYSFGRTYQIMGDLLSDNVYLSNSQSNRFTNLSSFLWTSESADALNIWRYTYYSILQANRILSSNLPRTENVNYLLGECYAARALCYFYLVNWFAKPYTVDANAPGVPLVLVSANITGPLVYPARNTVGEVYNQIVSDLDSAYNMMAATPKLHANTSNFLSKFSAKALQARAYLFMGQNAKAREAALQVINNGGYTLAADNAAYQNYWTGTAGRTDKLESIFEINYPSTASNGVEGLDYAYSPKGLGDLLATDTLYNLYTATDIRRGLIRDSTRVGKQAYVVHKYKNATGADRDQIRLMRYAEVLLIAAEAYARSSDVANALTYLNTLAKKRDPSFAGYTNALSAAELVEIILRERQRELAFEGFRYLDLQRTNVDFKREDMGTKAISNYTSVLKSDYRRIQPIPLSERNVNTNIEQNKDY